MSFEIKEHEGFKPKVNQSKKQKPAGDSKKEQSNLNKDSKK